MLAHTIIRFLFSFFGSPYNFYLPQKSNKKTNTYLWNPLHSSFPRQSHGITWKIELIGTFAKIVPPQDRDQERYIRFFFFFLLLNPHRSSSLTTLRKKNLYKKSRDKLVVVSCLDRIGIIWILSFLSIDSPTYCKVLFKSNSCSV